MSNGFRNSSKFSLFLGMEMVGGHWKTYVGVGLEFPWALGYSVLPGIAYVLRVSLNLSSINLITEQF
jgi:hypothetical protein